MIALSLGDRPVTRLGFLPDGRLIAGVNHDRRLWSWAPGESQARPRAFPESISGRLIAVAITAAKPWVAVQTTAGGLYVFDWNSGKVSVRAVSPARRSQLIFSPDGRVLFVARRRFLFGGWQIHRWLIEESRELPVLSPIAQTVTALAVTPDGQRLATGSDDRQIRFWDLKTGEQGGFAAWVSAWLKRLGWSETQDQLGEYRNRTGIRDLAFSPDGHWLAAATGWRASLWSATAAGGTQGQIVLDAPKDLRGHQRLVDALSFSPDSQMLATAGRDGAVKLWHIPTGRQTASFEWGIGKLYSVAFSPDGLQAAVGGDGKVVVWDVE